MEAEQAKQDEERKAKKTEREKKMEVARKASSGIKNEPKKSFPIRMKEGVKNDFAAIADMEGITQGEVLERFVRLYDVDTEDRLEAWEALFGTRESMIKQREERRAAILKQMEQVEKEFQENLDRQKERKRQRLENGEKW